MADGLRAMTADGHEGVGCHHCPCCYGHPCASGGGSSGDLFFIALASFFFCSCLCALTAVATRSSYTDRQGQGPSTDGRCDAEQSRHRKRQPMFFSSFLIHPFSRVMPSFLSATTARSISNPRSTGKPVHPSAPIRPQRHNRTRPKRPAPPLHFPPIPPRFVRAATHGWPRTPTVVRAAQ